MYSKAQFVRTSPRYHQFTDVYDYNKNDVNNNIKL